MEKEKGFTLIELLAVIVILAILMVIAVPKILNVIENSKKSAAESSIKLLKDAIKTQVTSESIMGTNFTSDDDGCYTFNFDDQNSGNSKALQLKNKEKITGTIKYCNGKFSDDLLEFDTTEMVKNCQYKKGKTFEFDYSGKEDTFVTPCDGIYKFETWGAQGGSSGGIGGYGAYSVGTIKLHEKDNIYINVGGEGKTHPNQGTNESYWFNAQGGYNGGGSAYASCGQGGGGGATHIALVSGLLSTLSEKQDSILIVSSGGGGAYHWKGGDGNGNSGGGYEVTPTYTSKIYVSGTFGQGGSGRGSNCGGGGGGGGFLGGGAGLYGGGGSSYIANPKLTNKAMYCYNCDESSDESTKTISTENVSETPISNYAKKGNGYVKITLMK